MLAALGRERLGRPVKVALTPPADVPRHHPPHRHDAAGAAGRRPRTGTLTAIGARLDCPPTASRRGTSRGRGELQTRTLYAAPNRLTRHRLVRPGPAGRQRHARAGRGVGHAQPRSAPWTSWPRSWASTRSSCGSATSRRRTPRSSVPFSIRQLVPLHARGRRAVRLGPAQRKPGPGARRAAGWSAWAWPPPSAATCCMPSQGAASRLDAGRRAHGAAGHDRHRHRHLHRPGADRRRDAGRAARAGAGGDGRQRSADALRLGRLVRRRQRGSALYDACHRAAREGWRRRRASIRPRPASPTARSASTATVGARWPSWRRRAGWWPTARSTPAT